MKKIVRAKDLQFIPASHETRSTPGVFKKVLFEKLDIIPGRVQMINWAFLPKGKSFRKHFHEDMDEIFILLKGCVSMEIDYDIFEMEKGDGVNVPMNSNHKMTNLSDGDVEYIVIGVSIEKNGKTIVVEK